MRAKVNLIFPMKQEIDASHEITDNKDIWCNVLFIRQKIELYRLMNNEATRVTFTYEIKCIVN